MPLSNSPKLQNLLEADDSFLKQGKDISGAIMPTGGSSVRGWISAIFKLFKDVVSTNNRVKTDSNLLAPLELNLTATALVDILPETDVSNYRYASVSINTTTTNQLFFEGRNSQSSNWFVIPIEQRLSPTASFIGLIPGSPSIYGVPLSYKFFRIRLASYAAGSTSNITVLLYQHPPERLTVGGRVVIDGGTVSTTLPAASALSDTISRILSTPTVGCANLLDNSASLIRWKSPAVNSGEGFGRAKVATGTELVILGSTAIITNGATVFLGSAYAIVTMQLVIVSGTLTAINCDLQGSLNGTNWFTLVTLTEAANSAKLTSLNVPVLYLRYRLNSFAGTTPSLQFLACAV